MITINRGIMITILAWITIGSYGQNVKETNIFDTANVGISFNKDIVGEITDTTYFIKSITRTNGEHWKVYDYTFPKILLLDYFCEDDTCTWLHYHKNSQLAEKTIEVKNKGLIYFARWCENGQLIFEVDSYSPDLPPQLYTDYYCNGRKRSEYMFEYIKVVGEYKKWHPNGRLKIKGQFDENGNKTGIWYYYNKKGKLKKKEQF